MSIKFIDLFAGMGGIRKGFEQACSEYGLESECVFTSEIKPYAVEVLKQNNPNDEIHGDITQVDELSIPDFDFLLGGFPCQAFSAAGKRLGFTDTRGTLFFDVERIIKAKKPFGFILENVEGLVNHDRQNKSDKIGKTLGTILEHLEDLGYHINWRVLNAKDFAVPQERKRVYIVGTRKDTPNLNNFIVKTKYLSEVLVSGLTTAESIFIKQLLKNYPAESLYGKAIKDKRGGDNNIHSWDIGIKGAISDKEKSLLNTMLKERRKRRWAEEFGIDWMDGMPLTVEQIKTFYDDPILQQMLDNLQQKGYLKLEHPKKRVDNKRVQDTSLPLGYNIVTGKMSFEVNKILDPNTFAPTLVAMDMKGLFVVDGKGIRNVTLREGLGMFGYPEDFKFDVSIEDGYDLLGNTVVVPVIREVSKRILDIYILEEKENAINTTRNI